ncbi:hypothetical protein AALC17_01825 [Oscillospiraceae bacterium 38-13]
MGKIRGRPPSDNPKNNRFFICVTAQEKAEIYAFARSSGYSLLELLRKGIEAVKVESEKK